MHARELRRPVKLLLRKTFGAAAVAQSQALYQMRVPNGTSTQERSAINILPSALFLRTAIIETDALSGCNMGGGGWTIKITPAAVIKPATQRNLPEQVRRSDQAAVIRRQARHTQHSFHRNAPAHATPLDLCSYAATVRFRRPSKAGGTVCPSDAKATLNDN